MDTPICDFVKKYAKSDCLRLHMPGHKGKNFLGFEHLDVTEFDGADNLFSANGIIKKSQENASAIFGANTFYSTEGSSLSIRAMLFLAVKFAREKGIRPLIFASRNAHRAFISACATIDFEVQWLYGNNQSYLSCNISAIDIDKAISALEQKPVAVYLTSPDYLGNTLDIRNISKVCKKHGVLLLVDNAHGAYLKFLTPSLHPIDLGADMCCDSAHKTLSAITGAGYLHISKNAHSFFKENVQDAMALFSSTSPSYLILQSLDILNAYLSSDYAKDLNECVIKVDNLKKALINNGYTLVGNEKLKICINAKKYGYLGEQLNKILSQKNIVCEFYDKDFIVFMFSPQTLSSDFKLLESALLSINKKQELLEQSPTCLRAKKALSIRQATMLPSKKIKVEDANGKIIAESSLSCPPAVSVAVSGEVIDGDVISALKYYGFEYCKVDKD